MIMFMLNQIVDQMLAGNYLGPMDRLSLMIVAIRPHKIRESGRSPIRFPSSPIRLTQSFKEGLCLTTIVVRAWARYIRPPGPLLRFAYLKEADSILARRSETNANSAQGSRQPAQKASPRFPKAVDKVGPAFASSVFSFTA